MRCFIAIDVPYFDSVASLQRSIEGRVKLVEKENIHITLKFLGEVNEENLKNVEDAFTFIQEMHLENNFKLFLKEVKEKEE